MLILTRRLGETLVIGDDVHVTVLGVSGNQVRLGIAAPISVDVDREEIYLRKQAEQSGNTVQTGNTISSATRPKLSRNNLATKR